MECIKLKITELTYKYRLKEKPKQVELLYGKTL